jgi:hypothetical protein
MTDQEKRELDVWIAERLFGTEVRYDDDGEPYNAKSKFSELIFGWIPRYTTDDRWLGKIKRELEKREWDWYMVKAGRSYHFAIWDKVRLTVDGVSTTPPELGCGTASSESLAVCLAVKEALGDHA